VTVALFETPFSVAVTLPLPAVVPALNVVEAPVAGETEPPGTFVDHDAPAVEAGFPHWSTPVALNGCEPPAGTEALDGETVIEVAGPALIVSVCVALVSPVALAVIVGLPAFVSR
jgi:hypothetical protein